MKLQFRYLLLLMFFLFTKISFGQQAMHSFKYHINSAKVIDVCAGAGNVYAAYTNGLLQYDVEQKEKTIWSITNYLSDVFISKIYFDTLQNACWIGYKNGNIDIIINNTVYNIPYFKMSSVMTDKSIIQFQSDRKFIYATFSSGILKIDKIKKEIKDTYVVSPTESNLMDCAIYKDSLYVLSKDKLYLANSSNAFLSDPSQWKKNTLAISDTIYNKLLIVSNKLFLNANYNNLYAMNNSVSLSKITDIEQYENTTKIEAFRNQWALFYYGAIRILDSNFKLTDIIYRYNDQAYETLPEHVDFYNNTYWVGDKVSGLVKWEGNFKNTVLDIFDMPTNSSFSIAYGKNNVIGVTGGTTSKTGFEFNSDGFSIFDGTKWKWYTRFNQKKWKNKLLFDVGSMSFNPKKTGEFAVGSNSSIPLSISYSGSQIDTVFTDENSTLKKSSIGNGWIFVSDVAYDKDGNLWVLNPFSSNPLKVYTATHKWVNIELPSSVTNSWARKLIIDYNGNKWITFPGLGIVGINTGNSIESSEDDVYKFINDGEVTGALDSKDVSAIATDFDNNLWIGTDQGFMILYNASSILSSNYNSGYTVQRIKLKYEGNVEYLLGKTSISDIEIDGGNRKWIATTNAGVFLLSADGNQLLQSFTKENGSLISNNIEDIGFNHSTGELYIVTDLGLVTYRADASEGKSDYESTIVFPNPYKPEHTKGITIQGIKYDSDIKVTDASGNVVYKTTSNGGTAFWNALDWSGNRVSPGVYFFWTAPNDENVEGKKVGKVVVF